MKGSTVNLLRTITLTSSNGVIKYDLAELYNSCLQEWKEVVSWNYRNRYVNSDRMSNDDLIKLSEHLIIFENSFLSKLQNKNLFSTQSIRTLSLKKVVIRITSFDLEKEEFVLTIFCISNDAKFIDSVGNYIILCVDENTQSEGMDTICVELTPDLSLAKITKVNY